ncbi:MAG: hypothetical protein ABJF01_07335 [bacterium]
MGIDEIADLLIFASAGLFGTTLIFATLWVRARERAIRASLELQARENSAAEMNHLVHGIDSIAIEVERISEAQRFTAQVLAGMEPASAPRRVPERVITPH